MHQPQPVAMDRGQRGRERRPVEGIRRLIFQSLLARIGHPPLAVELPDGTYLATSDSPLAIVRIRGGWPWWKMCLWPTREFGEAYARGDVQIEGDLSQLLTRVYLGMNENQRGRRRLGKWLAAGKSLRRSRDEISHHYDLGTDFYRLWLDPHLVYTCAYYPQPDASLEAAQLAKLDYVCRKLRLRPDERVIEAGCGWGALALYMAEHYGVCVRAYNISQDQLRYAREEARRRGLQERVEFVDGDWRQIEGTCDAFVSVGMLEHVGLTNYERLGAVIARCLEPHGRGLIHSIGQNRSQPLNPWITRRIFPGAYPPTLSEMMRILQPHDLTVLDVENLRPHYAATLRHWLERFEQAVDEVRRMFDESFVRIWRLYLAGSLAAFESGSLQLFQVVFARSAWSTLRWTRSDLYAEPPVCREPAPAVQETKSWNAVTF